MHPHPPSRITAPPKPKSHATIAATTTAAIVMPANLGMVATAPNTRAPTTRSRENTTWA